MKKKTLIKTICFKTTQENYNYLKMSGNVNKKLNVLVNKARLIFEEYQQDLPLDVEMVTKSMDLSLPDELRIVSDQQDLPLVEETKKES